VVLRDWKINQLDIHNALLNGFCDEKVYVAPDITAALKLILELWKKNRFLASGSFRGKRSCLRSRHLVLWSLGTLTGQQRFYGSGLVT
jgi:hypothetical protein